MTIGEERLSDTATQEYEQSDRGYSVEGPKSSDTAQANRGEPIGEGFSYEGCHCEKSENAHVNRDTEVNRMGIGVKETGANAVQFRGKDFTGKAYPHGIFSE